MGWFVATDCEPDMIDRSATRKKKKNKMIVSIYLKQLDIWSFLLIFPNSSLARKKEHEKICQEVLKCVFLYYLF